LSDTDTGLLRIDGLLSDKGTIAFVRDN